jgi:DNA-binding response OmpR family regulator
VVDMTAGDFRLLEVLLEAPGRALSRDTILDRMHGRSWSPYDRSIDNQIARLRKKIEVDPANPNIIKTVRGIGYTLAVPVRRV